MQTPTVETHERGGSLTTQLCQVRIYGTVELLQDGQRLDEEEVHIITLSCAPRATVEIVGQGLDTLVLKVRRGP